MGALLLVLDMIAQQGEGMTVRAYGKKHGIGGMFFNAVICLFAMVFFFVTDKGCLSFSKELVAYGLVSCLMYATGFYAGYLAFQTGSYVATKLISSFSVVIAIFYGILFLNEPAGVFTYIAITVFVISMLMMNYRKTNESERKDFSVKWLICALLAAVSNGLIAVISREQQLYFDGACDNEFMILSFGGAFAFLLVFGIVREIKNIGYILKNGTLYGIIAGIFNGAKNFIGLALYLYIPISVATPLKTGLGFILSFIISVLIYKEKFTKIQIAGVALGAVSLVMFKL
ncbi:MAG: EamA family transporter [Clostridia bacterium]|nr:EamA family transporter [Clostridia bacterium]